MARGTIDLDKALELLGVSAGASEQQIHAAYMEQVRRHPPDREPELFEQVRDAYNAVRDPAARAQLVLEGPDPAAPMVALLGKEQRTREFVGAQLWLAALKDPPEAPNAR